MESLNWAAVYHLPVLFVCEDNRISATTDSAPMTGGEGASARAQSIGVPAVKIDGNDVEAVSKTAAGLIAQIRAGQGPRLLHALTDRHKGHVSVDPGTYRDPEAVKAALARDPIALARRRLQERGLSAQAAQIDAEAKAEIAAALADACAAPPPEAAQAYTDIMNTGAGAWA